MITNIIDVLSFATLWLFTQKFLILIPILKLTHPKNDLSSGGRGSQLGLLMFGCLWRSSVCCGLPVSGGRCFQTGLSDEVARSGGRPRLARLGWPFLRGGHASVSEPLLSRRLSLCRGFFVPDGWCPEATR